jgi:Protein of unknown function (DUF2946)
MVGVRRHKRVLGWLAIIALLSNVLTAGLLAPSMAAAPVDDVLGPLVICTADGAKMVPGNGGSGRHAPSDHCPDCVTVKPFAFAVAVVETAIAFPPQSVARPARVESRSPAVHVSLGGIRSRAPPLFV